MLLRRVVVWLRMLYERVFTTAERADCPDCAAAGGECEAHYDARAW